MSLNTEPTESDIQLRHNQRTEAEAEITTHLYNLLRKYPADHEGAAVVRELLRTVGTHQDLPEGFTPTKELGFQGTRVYHILMRARIKCVELLVTMTTEELLELPQFGEGSLQEVTELLAARGLKLKRA